MSINVIFMEESAKVTTTMNKNRKKKRKNRFQVSKLLLYCLDTMRGFLYVDRRHVNKENYINIFMLTVFKSATKFFRTLNPKT